MNLKAVLFDLDGTLIDSAPDLSEAVDKMRRSRGLDSIPSEYYRPMAGAGARGMLKVAFDIEPEHPDFPELREEFFSNYEQGLLDRTYAFEGVSQMLESLGRLGIIWGIVTNKSKRFTHAIVRQMDVLKTCSVVVSGDTTPYSKPHPQPILHALHALGVNASECIYVGDDKRDIDAAKAANVIGLAAQWGYLGEHDISQWGANAVLDSPNQLIEWIKIF